MVRARKFTKSFGTLGKIISIIPDSTELIGKGIDNTRPIVEKYMDQRHQRHENLRKVDDVLNLPLDEAKAHLEKSGFVVASIPAKADKKWIDSRLNEVVIMSPKSSKQPLGSLVKLYYVTIDTLEKSQAIKDSETLRHVEFNQKIADSFDHLKNIHFPFNKN